METVEQPLDLTRSDNNRRESSEEFRQQAKINVATESLIKSYHSQAPNKDIDELKRASSTYKEQANLSSYSSNDGKLKQRVMLPHKLRHRELSYLVPETERSQQLDQMPEDANSRCVPTPSTTLRSRHQLHQPLATQLDGPSSQTRVVLLDPSAEMVDSSDVAMQRMVAVQRKQTAVASLGGEMESLMLDYRRRLADGNYAQQPSPLRMTVAGLAEEQHNARHREQLQKKLLAAAAAQRANFSGFSMQEGLNDNLPFALRQQSLYSGMTPSPAAAAMDLTAAAEIAMPPFQALLSGGGGVRSWQQAAAAAHKAAMEMELATKDHGELSASEAAALKGNVAAAYLMGMPPPLIPVGSPHSGTIPSPPRPSPYHLPPGGGLPMRPLLPLLPGVKAGNFNSLQTTIGGSTGILTGCTDEAIPRMHDILARATKTDITEAEHRCCDQALCTKCVRDSWQSSSSSASVSSMSASAFNQSTPPSPVARLSMDSRSDLMSLPSPLMSPYSSQDPRSPAGSGYLASSASERYGYEVRLSADKMAAALGGATAFSTSASNRSSTSDLRSFAPRMGLVPGGSRALVSGSVSSGVPQSSVDPEELAKSLLHGGLKQAYKRRYEPTSTPYERSVGVRKQQRLSSSFNTSGSPGPNSPSLPIFPPVVTTASADSGVSYQNRLPSTSDGQVSAGLAPGYSSSSPAMTMKQATAAAAVPLISPQAQQARNSDAAVLRRWHSGLHLPADTNFADMPSGSGGRSLLTVNWSVMSGGAMRVCSSVPATAAAAALARDTSPVTSSLPVVRRVLNATDPVGSGGAVLVDF